MRISRILTVPLPFRNPIIAKASSPAAVRRCALALRGCSSPGVPLRSCKFWRRTHRRPRSCSQSSTCRPRGRQAQAADRPHKSLGNPLSVDQSGSGTSAEAWRGRSGAEELEEKERNTSTGKAGTVGVSKRSKSIAHDGYDGWSETGTKWNALAETAWVTDLCSFLVARKHSALWTGLPTHRPCTIPGSLLDELALVSALGPMSHTNLRSTPLLDLCATDASPQGCWEEGGEKRGVGAEISRDKCSELYDVADRGFQLRSGKDVVPLPCLENRSGSRVYAHVGKSMRVRPVQQKYDSVPELGPAAYDHAHGPRGGAGAEALARRFPRVAARTRNILSPQSCPNTGKRSSCSCAVTWNQIQNKWVATEP